MPSIIQVEATALVQPIGTVPDTHGTSTCASISSDITKMPNPSIEIIMGGLEEHHKIMTLSQTQV